MRVMSNAMSRDLLKPCMTKFESILGLCFETIQGYLFLKGKEAMKKELIFPHRLLWPILRIFSSENIPCYRFFLFFL